MEKICTQINTDNNHKVMSKLSFEDTFDWRSTSKYILSLFEIRFVWVIDNMGQLVDGNYKNNQRLF